MPSTFTSHASCLSGPVIRWVFQRDADAITCELDAIGDRSYDVCVVPHRDVTSSIVQHLDAPAAALLRHGQIARQLRDSG